MPSTYPTTRFNWTGKCRSCGGPSNRYDFQNRNTGKPTPTRHAIVLAGDVQLASGKTRRFRAAGVRVEVCYRCYTRWRRNQSFIPKVLRLEPAFLDQIRELLRVGLTVAAIARAVDKPQRTVAEWVETHCRDLHPKKTRTSATSSSARSRPRSAPGPATKT